MSPAPFVKLSALVALVMLVMGLGGCPEDEVEVPNLFLEITSDAPDAGRLESLRILLVKGDARYPESAGDSGFNPSLGALDPASGPVLVSVAYDGDTFGDGRDVVVQILGRMGNRPVTRFEGSIDLDEALVFKVHLSALPPGCDDDEDGFLDCGIEGCCAAGSAFADCGGADANTNPWAVEAECEPCADTIDQDCRGGDVPCVDDDDDAIADCAETCGRGDPRSGPGLPEICDGKDNDCDDQTDEGLTLVYRGEVFDKGDACGLGACGGGVVECDGQGGLRCSSEGQRAEAEDCGTAADDNCNGLVNEGCSLADFDGDGSLAPEDCNDNDAGVFPGRTREPCCPASAQGDPAAEAACDKNCDGDVDFCEAGDADGDGVTVAEGDCDDGDASVAPGKPERCGDGIDQDCAGGDLACAQVIDGDGDGWPSAVDCDDGEAAVGPGELEVCNGRDDDCDGLVDEGNPGGGGQCGTSDVGACAFGVEHCQNSSGVVGQVVCVGAIDAAAADVCDGRDEDCDGETDEDFRYEGLAIGQACVGVGACGAGTVECAPGRSDLATCSTNPDGSASEAASEVCDALDNDCDGELNEGLDDVEDSTCLNLGVCAAGRQAIVATCNAEGVWLCDYGAVAGYEDGGERSCDGLDNDCDGLSDEDFAFTEPDGTVRGFGTGCDGADSDACRNGIVACAPGDVTRVVCSETGGPFEELCDGADNDCDGATDEDFLDTSDNRVRLSGALFAGDNGAYLGDACGAGACGGGEVICGSTTTLKCSTDPRTPASPSAPTDVCDELDNDCDGTTDESYIAGGTVKLSGALLAADNGKVKGASCGAGECAGGTVVCGSPTTLVCSTDVNGKTTVDGQTVTKTDTCNGLDDNCNGTTDDDFVATSGASRKPLANALFSGDNGKIKGASCGVGECAKPSAGTVVCNEEGTALLCSSDERAQTDLCDNLDNDCDGTTDDPYLAGGTVTLTNAKYTVDNGKVKNASCGTGLCASGKVVCTASKTALVCDTDTKATTEVCDDVDNDCDGTKDEGYLYNGLTVGTSCDGIGGCGFGTVVCAVGSTSTATCSTNPNGPLSQVQNELCDGVDNDCDDQTDEGFTYNNVSLGGGCTGVGACGSGTVVCSTQNTSAATCSTMPDGTASQASVEQCNSADDDCDGSTDEDFGLGTACDGVGECGAGVIECSGASATRCSTSPGGSAYVAVAEVCDGLDQDCDGATDNGFPFVDDAAQSRQVGQSCEGVGECGVGVVECASTSASRCSTNPDGSEAEDEAEICDGLDNDCDGTDDDGFEYEGEPIGGDCDGVGECGDGVVECATTSTTTCSTNANGSASEATTEMCDALDHDCDGDNYNGFTYENPADPGVKAVGDACDGLGLCGTGTVECVSTMLADCSTNPGGSEEEPAPEVCDELDNDCDGEADDGFDYEGVAIGATCDGIGECGQGQAQCVDEDTTTCSTNPDGTSSQAIDELCDELDNDCDTSTDEDFSYTNPVEAGGEVRAIGQSCEGIGECGAGTVECATTSAATCSTNPDGSVPEDETESCNELDDDCDSMTDEGLDDIDDDGECDDGVDGCVDVDGDGIGRDSEDIEVTYSHDACVIPDEDCNDELDNGQDLDGDNVCNTGVGTVCEGGTATGCDDNCPEVMNASQADANGNAVGDACDWCDEVDGGEEPFEVCANCLDDDCSCVDQSGDCAAEIDDASCVYRRVLAITTGGDGIPAGYSVSFTFDHAFLVGAGRSDADGDDVRLYWRNPASGVFTEIDRVLDPESSWDSDTTTVWFQAQEGFTATSDANRDYYLYHGVSGGAPLADESDVFVFADYFGRADGVTVGGAWAEQEEGGLQVRLDGGSLDYSVTLDARLLTPSVWAAFGELSAGRVLVRTKWNWSETSTPGQVDDQYAVAVQVGSFGANTTSATSGSSFSTSDVIATVAWGKNFYSLDAGGELALSNSATRTTVLGGFDGSDIVDLTIDFATDQVSADPDGPGVIAGVAAAFSDPAATLKDIRIWTSKVNATGGNEPFPSRKFDYVYVRRLLAAGQPEPVVRFGGIERLAPRCALAGEDDVIARYHFDDPRDDDADTLVVKDTIEPVAHMTRDTVSCGADCLQPEWRELLGLWGLEWVTESAGGAAELQLSTPEGATTKFVDPVDGLQGATAATIELVVDLDGGIPLTDAYLFDISASASRRLALAIRQPAKDTYEFDLWVNDGKRNAWTLSVGQGGWGRSVLHVVIDLSLTGRDQFRLYRDGVLMADDASITPPEPETIDLTLYPTLMVGNSPQGEIASLASRIAYFAAYRTAFDAATATGNALKLLANDDRR